MLSWSLQKELIRTLWVSSHVREALSPVLHETEFDRPDLTFIARVLCTDNGHVVPLTVEELIAKTQKASPELRDACESLVREIEKSEQQDPVRAIETGRKFAAHQEALILAGQLTTFVKNDQWGEIRNRTERLMELSGAVADDEEGLVVQRASDVPSEKVSWLWPGFVPYGKVCTMEGDGGLGKALALDTPIPTPHGWKTFGELEVGNLVYNDSGRPTKVVALTPIWYDRPCYQLTFSTGETIIADENHLWATTTTHDRRRVIKRRYKTKKRGGPPLTKTRSDKQTDLASLKTTKQIAETLIYARKRTPEKNHAISVASPVSGVKMELPIPPYVLGVWLGDGHSSCGRVSGIDTPIFERVASLGFDVRQTNKYTWAVYDLSPKLRELRLLNNKHVPTVYLRGSSEQRLELLRGLMDTDGTIGTNGCCSFCNTNRSLIDGVYELCCSLGLKPTIRDKKTHLEGYITKPAWEVGFTTTTPVFHLARKNARLPTKLRKTQGVRYVVACDPVPNVPVRCIQVEAENGMFLCTHGMIPTHNSTVALDLVARVTSGRCAPFCDGPEHGLDAADCVVLSAEDAAGDTIRPRLEAAGADLSRVHLVSGVNEKYKGEVTERGVALDRDVIRLENLVLKTGAKFVVIDPIVAMLGGADFHRDQDVRRILKSLAKMAERRKCAVMTIRHLNKDKSGSLISRGGGSIGFVAAVRTAMIVLKHPESSEDRVIAVYKTNLVKAPPPVVYRFLPGSDVASIMWAMQSNKTVEELTGGQA